jgi:hypothetical protein
MRYLALIFLLMIAGIVPAQAAQQLTCKAEKVALDEAAKVNDDLAFEFLKRLEGVNALPIVAHHNANSALQLDGDGWSVVIMKLYSRASGEELPTRAVFIGRNGEICRVGAIHQAMIDRLLATIPGA